MPPTKRARTLTPTPDLDSTMHSSADEDEMFPDEALPNTTAELSPPNSQGGASRDTSTLSSAVNANGKRPLSLAQGAPAAGAHTDAETGYSWSKQEEQPGWEWKNTRAREEENRALDSIVDLGAQIKCRSYIGEFG